MRRTTITTPNRQPILKAYLTDRRPFKCNLITRSEFSAAEVRDLAATGRRDVAVIRRTTRALARIGGTLSRCRGVGCNTGAKA